MLPFFCLICPKTAEARLEFSQSCSLVDPWTEPKTIFTSMRQPHRFVCHATVHEKSALSVQNRIISDESLLEIGLQLPISVGKNCGIAVMRDYVHTSVDGRTAKRTGFLLLSCFFRREWHSDPAASSIEHVQRGPFPRVLEYDQNFDLLLF